MYQVLKRPPSFPTFEDFFYLELLLALLSDDSRGWRMHSSWDGVWSVWFEEFDMEDGVNLH